MLKKLSYINYPVFLIHFGLLSIIKLIFNES